MEIDEICLMTRVGVGCGLPEILVLSSLFYIAAIICFLLMILHIRSSFLIKSQGLDFNLIFWISMSIFLLYHGVINTISYRTEQKVAFQIHVCIDAILYLLPMSLLIYLIWNIY